MTTKSKTWTILEVLKWSENFLKEKGLAAPRVDAEQLLMAALNCERVFIYTHFDQPLTEAERAKYREYILRRAKQEPLQYITGFTYFMGLRLEVSREVLIPRPDTEVLVETVIDAVKRFFPEQELTILDIGTGSGAIAIALARFLPTVKIFAGDISEAALTLAKKNAQLNKVADRIEFVRTDLLSEMIHQKISGRIMLVANLPYISPEEFIELPREVKEHEPVLALQGGAQGLELYRRLADQAVIFGDQLAGIFFEVGYQQADLVKKLLENKFSREPKMALDLGGINRVVYTLLKT